MWTRDGVPVVFAYAVEDGKKTVKAWKLVELPAGKLFTPLELPTGTLEVSVSRTGSLVAFRTAGALSVYDTASWKETASFHDERVVTCLLGR